MNEEIDKNYKWFKNNLKKLLKKYNNKYLIISDEKVIYTATKENDAIAYASELEIGTFIIQKCVAEDKNNMQVFHTRAIFDE